MTDEFKNPIGFNIFKQKYAINRYETWRERAGAIVDDVCGSRSGTADPIMSKEDRDFLTHAIATFKFVPGGRYIYYAGRPASFFNNCYLLRLEEDTREAWADLTQRNMSCLLTGGGTGTDVSIARPSGRPLSRTGGVSSGPIPLLEIQNEAGRHVMQGGSRRSALYGSLNWQHGDVDKFLVHKDWDNQPVGDTTIGALKKADFNFRAPLDMMNISINYDNAFLQEIKEGNIPETFRKNVEMALRNGEPGFSFNFGDKEYETLRNACTEITSEDDSDVCNLGSINLARIESADELSAVVRVASKFLVCGTIRADLPYEKVREVRRRNRRLGLGIMGLHEWLLKRGYKYGINKELRSWLDIYRDESKRAADRHCDRLYLSRPKGYRAIAPTGTISIIAGTTSGIEPIYAVAYKRRYIVDGTRTKFEFVVDAAAEGLIQDGIKPEDIESAVDLAADPERRINFQAEVQQYVDHAISSTLNLPAWGSELNNEDKVADFAALIAKHAPNLRGLTMYPDGARGGQPITSVDYTEAHSKRGVVFEDNSEEQCLSGVCGI
jgi:ribonucleoside-diphosphate reductase alpha chain